MKFKKTLDKTAEFSRKFVKSVKKYEFPRWLIWTLVFLFFLNISLHKLDPDFGWHYAAGRDILENGIPSSDIFTYSAANFQWINVEWLNDVLVAKLYDFGGYVLLAIIFSFLWTCALMLVGKGVSAPLIFAAALMISPYSGVRTQLWMVFFIALVFAILQLKRKNLRLILIPIFLLWAQIHGSWPAGLALMGWWMLFRENEIREKLKLCGLIIICLLVTLINPYGVNSYFVILQTAFDPALKTLISEWNPIWMNLPKGTVIYLVISLVSLIWFFANSINKNKLKKSVKTKNIFAKVSPDIYEIFREPMWPFLIASLTSTRYWPLFAITSLSKIDQIFREIVKSIPRSIEKTSKVILGGICTVLIMLFAFSFVKSGFSLSPVIQPEKLPLTRAINYIRENNCEGNLFNSYNFGGYLAWKLPEYKIFIDGRMPSWTKDGTLFGETYMTDYQRVLNEDDFRNEIFAKYNITCVLIDINSNKDFKLAVGLQKSDDWEIVLNNNDFVLFVKNEK